jgi:hypothetical protein
VELGALLWLLSLPADCHHRLGGGKPLGFGSVRLEIAGHDLRDGDGWKAYYGSLEEAAPPPFDPAQAVSAFQQAATQVQRGRPFETVPFIAAFLRAARGFEDRLPVHYPRAQAQGLTGPVPPSPEGRAFAWFVANERTGRNAGPHCGLPDLVDDPGLPFLEDT